MLIGAKDGGGLLSTSNASVIVQIVDNNTNVPKFALREWNVTIKENSPAGTSIGAFAIENSDGVHFLFILFICSPSFDILRIYSRIQT